MLFEVEVDDSSFREWVDKSIENVKTMGRVLEDIKVIIWQHTIHRVPLDKGFLESSFFEYSNIVSEYPLFELKIEMTGIDNPDADGWDYALYQYENDLNHPIKGEMYYLKNGWDEAKPQFMKYLETDYLTALGV